MSFDTFIQKGGGGGAPQGRKRKPRGGAGAPTVENAEQNRAPTIENAKRKAVEDLNAMEPTFNLPEFMGGSPVYLGRGAQTISDMVRMGAKGASRNFSDEIGAGIDVASSHLGNMIGTREPISYADALAQQRSQDIGAEARLESTTPGASTFFQIAPQLVGPAAIEALPARTPFLGKVGATVAEGAAESALGGLGEGRSGREILTDAMLGGGLGLGSSVGGRLLRGTFNKLTGADPNAAIKAAREEADQAFLAKSKRTKKGQFLSDLRYAEAGGKKGLNEFDEARAGEGRRTARTYDEPYKSRFMEEERLIREAANTVNPRKVKLESRGDALQGAGGLGKFNMGWWNAGLAPATGSLLKGRAKLQPDYNPDLVEAAKVRLRGTADAPDRDTLIRLINRASLGYARQ